MGEKYSHNRNLRKLMVIGNIWRQKVMRMGRVEVCFKRLTTQMLSKPVNKLKIIIITQ